MQFFFKTLVLMIYSNHGELLPNLGVRKLPMYSCRHTMATALAVGKNTDIAVIREVMRHSKITTTQRDMHPDTTDARNALNKLSPQGAPIFHDVFVDYLWTVNCIVVYFRVFLRQQQRKRIIKNKPENAVISSVFGPLVTYSAFDTIPQVG